MFFKRNLSNIMELFHDVSFNNCCLQNEMKQGLFLQQCREINSFVLIKRNRVWRSQQQPPPPQTSLKAPPSMGCLTIRDHAGGGAGKALAPPLFWMVIFFSFGYPDESLTTQKRFSNLTILNTPKQRTDQLCLVAVANNENRKGNINTFRESDLKMFG